MAEQTKLADASNARKNTLREQIASLIGEFFELEPEPPADESPLSTPLYGAGEVNAALECLLEKKVTMGSRVAAFESNFAEFIGAEHAIMVNSGSSANLIAVSVLCQNAVKNGLRPGDEVIIPAVTWSTTIAPVLQLGCIPVLVDIDEETLNFNPDSIEAAMSDRTRAIFPVHLLGNPVDMKPLMQVAEQNRLWVIEDTCESLGSEIAGKKAGSFGHFGTFSFYFSHHITTIEGGMIVTDDQHLADLARSLRAHGWTRDMSSRQQIAAANPHIDPYFLFVNVGYNLRPMEMQAAFGEIQLQRLDEFNERRRENARILHAALERYGDQLRLVSEQQGGRSTWFGFSVILPDAETRSRLRDHLESRKIATRPIVAGNLAIQPAFRDSPHRVVGDLANATSIGERGLFIGNHPNLTTAQLDYIIAAFHDFFT